MTGGPVDAWIVRPPNFDPSKKYPLLLEIHGGPFTAYRPDLLRRDPALRRRRLCRRLLQSRAGRPPMAASSANVIHHNYPSQDYDDLMSVVDAAIAKEPIDTNGSTSPAAPAAACSTAWIVGSTDRFAAAMVQKPVINWTSEVLSADGDVSMSRYWFGELPWEKARRRAIGRARPCRKVGNVKTPTGVLVGEEDNRTPHSEAEQYYQALQIRKVPDGADPCARALARRRRPADRPDRQDDQHHCRGLRVMAARHCLIRRSGKGPARRRQAGAGALDGRGCRSGTTKHRTYRTRTAPSCAVSSSMKTALFWPSTSPPACPSRRAIRTTARSTG